MEFLRTVEDENTRSLSTRCFSSMGRPLWSTSSENFSWTLNSESVGSDTQFGGLLRLGWTIDWCRCICCLVDSLRSVGCVDIFYYFQQIQWCVRSLNKVSLSIGFVRHSLINLLGHTLKRTPTLKMSPSFRTSNRLLIINSHLGTVFLTPHVSIPPESSSVILFFFR